MQHDTSHPRTCFVSVPEDEQQTIKFDPAQAKDRLPFYVGETEYLVCDDELFKAEEVRKLYNKREFEGQTWYDVLWANGEFTPQLESDLGGCDIDALLVTGTGKRKNNRRRKRKNKRQQHGRQESFQEPEEPRGHEGAQEEEPGSAEQAGSGAGGGDSATG